LAKYEEVLFATQAAYNHYNDKYEVAM